MLLPFILGIQADAQISIGGKVLDQKGQALEGINIYILHSFEGATSDSAGLFRFRTDSSGLQTLVASGVGYQRITRVLKLGHQDLVFNPVMKESINTLNLVTISAGSFEAGDAGRATMLKPLDIVSTAGAEADITQAIRTLPGAQQIGEQEGLFVRGGTGSETKTFIDGLLVSNPYFSSVPDIAQRGRFSPFLFQGTIFSSGGYSAQYGQGMSGALILKSQDLPDRSSSTLAVSSVGLSGGIDKLSRNKRFSYGGDLNYTNLWPYYTLSPQKQQYTGYPSFWNGDLNFRKKFSRGGMLKFYGYANVNSLGFLQPSLNYPGYQDLFTLKNRDIYTNLTYRAPISGKWSLYAGYSYSANRDSILIQSQGMDSVFNPERILRVNSLSEAKVMLIRNLGTLSLLRMGGEFQDSRLQEHFNGYQRSFSDQYSALFAETDLYATPKLVGRLGARMEYSSLLGKSDLAPRISLAYKVGAKDQFSLAYGIFYQEPDTLDWLTGNHLTFSRATHYILNFQRVSNDYSFRIEAYYKKYSGLVRTFPDTSNSGLGYARGIEVFWRDRKTFRNVDYWISYSFLDTKRYFLNYPIETMPTFAARHTLDLVYKEYIPKISTDIGLTYTFATGRPYFNPNLPSKLFLSDRTQDYNSLGLSLSYLTTIRKAFTVLVLSVSNALGNSLVYGYNYSSDGTRRQSITPAASRFYFLGMFMSFGIDRRQSVLNSN